MKREEVEVCHCAPLKAQCSRVVRFQAGVSVSSNAFRRIESAFGNAGKLQRSLPLLWVHLTDKHTLHLPLPFRNSKPPFLTLFVRGRHGRAASLGTAAASTGPVARNLRNSKQSESVGQQRRLRECISIWLCQPGVKSTEMIWWLNAVSSTWLFTPGYCGTDSVWAEEC